MTGVVYAIRAVISRGTFDGRNSENPAPFVARAGSLSSMDGKLWTNGCRVRVTVAIAAVRKPECLVNGIVLADGPRSSARLV